MTDTTAVALRGVRVSRARPSTGRYPVLDIPKLRIEAGERVALLGPSGCGKTTLLHLLAGLLTADAGEVVVAGRDIARLSEASRDRFRASTTGVVFQSFNLLPTLSAIENVRLPVRLAGRREPGRARELLHRVGLAAEADAPATHLSVGQQQRVAVARAVVNRPRLVLADEPTGNLDDDAAATVADLLFEVCTEVGATLLLVTHDGELADRLDRTVTMAEINRVVPGGAA